MDRATFDQWVEEHRRDIVRVAAKVLGRRGGRWVLKDSDWKASEVDVSVDDLVQKALLRIYDTESYLRCQVSPMTWITNVVKAVAKDDRRSRGREAAMKTDLPHLVEDTGIPGIGSRHRSPAK